MGAFLSDLHKKVATINLKRRWNFGAQACEDLGGLETDMICAAVCMKMENCKKKYQPRQPRQTKREK